MNECRLEVKTNTNLIESEIHQFSFTERSKRKNEKKHQLIIIFFSTRFSQRRSCDHVMMSSYLVQPVSKHSSRSCVHHSLSLLLGQWNNEKAVCSYTKFFFFPRTSVYFVVDVMWPNNKSKWVFVHFKCFVKIEGKVKEAVKSKKKILVEWLIKLDIDKYCVCHDGPPLMVQTWNIISSVFVFISTLLKTSSCARQTFVLHTYPWILSLSLSISCITH